jgi:hypothetical protein
VEKGFEKIILQFTTDFENTLLFKGGWGDQAEHCLVFQSDLLIPNLLE